MATVCSPDRHANPLPSEANAASDASTGVAATVPPVLSSCTGAVPAGTGQGR